MILFGRDYWPTMTKQYHWRKVKENLYENIAVYKNFSGQKKKKNKTRKNETFFFITSIKKK